MGDFQNISHVFDVTLALVFDREFVGCVKRLRIARKSGALTS